MNIFDFRSVCKKLLVGLSSALIALAYNTHSESPRLNSIIVEVTGNEFNWYFRYPGEDGILGTNDDRHSVQNLYLPDNALVTLKLSSKDYVYSFALPDLSLEEIAVPDMSFEMQFKTGEEQKMTLMGDQLCGYIHPTLIGDVYIRNQNNGFYTWPNKS